MSGKPKNQESAEAIEVSSPGVEVDQPEVEVGDVVLFTPDDRHVEPQSHAAMVIWKYADGSVHLLVHGPGQDYRKTGIFHSTERAGTEDARGFWSFRPSKALI